ncbi:MAG: hypothetical protein ACE5FP_01845 [Gemmatimonadota bacterium]
MRTMFGLRARVEAARAAGHEPMVVRSAGPLAFAVGRHLEYLVCSSCDQRLGRALWKKQDGRPKCEGAGA